MFAYAPVAIDDAPLRVDDAAGAEDFLLPLRDVDGADGGDHRLRRRERDLSVQGLAGRRPVRRRVGRARRDLRPVRSLQRIAVGPQGVGRVVAVGRARHDGARCSCSSSSAICWCGSTAARAPRSWPRPWASSAPRRRRSSTSRSTGGARFIRRRASCKTLGDKFPAAWNLVWFCSGGVSAAVRASLLAARVRLEALRAELDRLYLAAEE